MTSTVTVPREPTPEMIQKGRWGAFPLDQNNGINAAGIYRAMLAAAPPVEDETAALRERMEALCQENASLRVEVERLKSGLLRAFAIADEAAREWDAAPEGMRAGKIILALAGHIPGYRADIDSVHQMITGTASPALLDQEKS